MVTGTVRSWRLGRALPDAFVILEPLDNPHGPMRLGARSDGSGRYLLRVPVGGSYFLLGRAIDAEAGPSARLPVHVRGGDTVRVDLFLPPRGFDPERRQAQLDELAENRRRWWDEKPAAYRATITYECFCLGAGVGEWTVEVRPDRWVVLRKPDGAGTQPPVPTVDDIFAILEPEVGDPSRSVTIRYHPTLGYPTHIDSHPRVPITDAWLRIRVRQLVPIPTSEPERRGTGRSPP